MRTEKTNVNTDNYSKDEVHIDKPNSLKSKSFDVDVCQDKKGITSHSSCSEENPNHRDQYSDGQLPPSSDSFTPVMLLPKNPSRPHIMGPVSHMIRMDQYGRPAPLTAQDYAYYPNGRPGVGIKMTHFLDDPNIDDDYKTKMKEKYSFLQQ